MKGSTTLVTVLVSLSLFFGLPTPLLFSSQIGALTDEVLVWVDTKNITASTHSVTLSFSSASVSINALYVHLSYDASTICDTVTINEVAFPLSLESTISPATREVSLALASPGYGVLATTTIATLSCTVSASTTPDAHLFTILPDSRAYAADGLGTELFIATNE